MSEPEPINLWKNKNRCISCAFLCYEGDKTIGIAIRRNVLESGPHAYTSLLDISYADLVCYKGILPSFYLSGYSPEYIHRIITEEDCQKNKWKTFINGQSPLEAEQQLSNRIAIRWSRFAFWAVIFSIILSLAYFIIANFLLKSP